MSDVAYRPNETAAPEPAPAETITLPNEQEWFEGHRDAGNLPAEGPFSDPGGATPEQVTDEGLSTRRQIERAMEEVRNRRSNPEFEPPRVTEIKSSRENYTGGSAVKDAARDYTLGRRGNEKAELMQQGLSSADAEAVVMQGEAPPIEIGVVDRAQNKVLRPLHEEDGRGRRITEDDALSVRDATRMQGDFREELAKYQADLLQRLQGQAPDQTAPVEAARIEAQPSQLSPEMAAQAEAINQQRQILASQAAYVNAQQQSVGMSAEERAIRENAQRWVNHLKATCPEANNPQTWAYTQQTNPRRAKEINQRFAQADRVIRQSQNRLNEINELRQGRAERWQRAQLAALDKRNDAWDAEAYDFLKEMPEFTNDKAGFRREVTKYLKEVTGWTDAQLDNEWHNGNLIRPPGAQKTIALAVRDRIRQEAVSPQRLRAHRRNVPSAHAPGNWMPRGTDLSAEIAAAQRRVEGARGERASVMAAAELTKLMRQAGRLS
jgi:hypothetical protein